MAKKYVGQPVATHEEKGIATNFDLSKSGKKNNSTKPLGVERSRSTIDLREARETLKKWQKPYRKV